MPRSISMPVAGLVSLAVAGPSLAGDLTPGLLLTGLGLAILLPVVPFALEMLSLQRLTAAAFGTLMSLEPAFAVLIGLVALGQVPGVLAVLTHEDVPDVRNTRVVDIVARLEEFGIRVQVHDPAADAEADSAAEADPEG